jgi:ubiquinone/menaquinone biosynthesis C-methylase UbiE
MWQVDQNDFLALEKWGHLANPFAARDDYSAKKEEWRWLNPEHRELYNQYVQTRLNYMGGKTLINYFNTAKRAIARDRWEYLKQRKAWYIMPLGWDNFSKQSCKIADFGCGDGDCIQRVADFLQPNINNPNYTAELTGIDINPSRIENATQLVKCNDRKIGFKFIQGDVIDQPLDFADGHFDFSFANGFFEILDDATAVRFAKEIARVSRKGIYIQDIAEPFPGGHPRENLNELFTPYGFRTVKRHIILSEPFQIEGTSDPKRLYPIIRVQNIWLERI